MVIVRFSDMSMIGGCDATMGCTASVEARLLACIHTAACELPARSRQPLGLGSQPAVPILVTDRFVHDRRWRPWCRLVGNGLATPPPPPPPSEGMSRACRGVASRNALRIEGGEGKGGGK